MQHLETISVMYRIVACFCIVSGMISCGNGNNAEENNCNGKVNDESPTHTLGIAEASTELTHVERMEVECRRLMIETDQRKEVVSDICKLCNEIRKLPKNESLPLFDRWIEMAIEQPVTNANYSTKAKLSERFFHIVFFSFMASQSMRTDPYEHWDKIFRFFSKYTNEIAAVERRLRARGCPQSSPSYIYLHDLQVCTDGWVYMTQSVFFNTLSKGLTEAQKVDILRRLDEVKKYTVPPSHSPFSEK